MAYVNNAISKQAVMIRGLKQAHLEFSLPGHSSHANAKRLI